MKEASRPLMTVMLVIVDPNEGDSTALLLPWPDTSAGIHNCKISG